MKAKFLALAALVLGLASCQTDPQDLDVTTGGEQAVTINVALPEEVTRAAGTDSALGGIGNVNMGEYDIRYILEVYDENGVLAKDRMVQTSDATSANFDLRLVPGRAYNFVVWADFVTNGTNDLYYDTSAGLRNVQVKDDKWDAIIEARDAYTDVFTVHNFSSTSTIDMTLTRPFAKLRVVTDDIDEMISIRPAEVKVKYFNTKFYTTFDAFAEKASGVREDKELTVTLLDAQKNGVDTYTGGLDAQKGVQTLFADYFFGAEDDRVMFTFDVKDNGGRDLPQVTFNTNIPVKRNNLTTVYGPILTDANNVSVTINPAFENADNPYDAPYYVEHKEASNAQELIEIFNEAENTDGEIHIVLTGDINLNDLANLTRANENVLPIVIKNGTTVELDLNKKVLSATTNADSGNQELFLVKGKLTVKNGTIEYEHVGQNMGWGAMTTIFDVTAGGVLNLEGVTATNKGGSDMGFVAHLNNWGEVTLNVDNCTLESNYVPVRVFNSGYDMNNVTIKNSTLKGVSAAFWVHNYTVEDFGSEAKAESQKALLNFDIFDNSNTFSPIVGIRYGFTNSIRFDSYGITRTVSEDGTIVTLDKFFGEGVVRRGVAGAEKNSDVKKVVVSEGITSLVDRTFYRYYALETVELPSTLKVLGANGDDYYTNGNVFQGCAALKNIVIPESVTTMGPGAFYGCSSLESINIPVGVTRIEKDALRETALVSVEFHKGVTYFGDMAFRDCKQLKEVYINAPEFTMEGNTFGIMAGEKPAMIIYVVNAEMKAYVESKLTSDAKTYITVKAPNVVTDKASLQAALKEALAQGEKNIFIDAKGAEFDLQYGLSQSNVPAGVTVTIRNANITGSGRWNYADGTVIFENCNFTAGVYSIHFDAGNGDVKFKNCNLVGWNSFGALNSVSFENCTLTGNGTYALIRSYADLTLTNCIINVSSADWSDNYSDGVQVLDGATLTENGVIYVVENVNALTDALKKKANTIKLGSNITVTEDWDNRFNGAKTSSPITIDGNGKTLKFTGKVDDKNYMSAFRFEAEATVKNLTIDMSEVAGTGGQLRAISSKEGKLIVDNCTFIGSTNYTNTRGVIFGEGVSEATNNTVVSVTNSTFTGWKRGLTDNENGKDAKSVTITGNTFNSAHCYVSAHDSIVFTDNTMNNSCVNLTTYTNATDATVIATDNILDNNLSAYNVISKFVAENVTCQNDFTVR